MSLDGAKSKHRAITLCLVVGASFFLGCLGMPTALHAMASLDIISQRPGPPPRRGPSANALG